jgi:hypothetical protein
VTLLAFSQQAADVGDHWILAFADSSAPVSMNQNLEDIEGLPEEQKQELMQKIEEMQIRDR